MQPADLPVVRIYRILVKPVIEKYFAFPEARIRCIAASSRPLQEGVSRSSRHVGCGMRWSQPYRRTSDAGCGRRNRVVLAPRRWRQAYQQLLAGDGG